MPMRAGEAADGGGARGEGAVLTHMACARASAERHQARRSASVPLGHGAAVGRAPADPEALLARWLFGRDVRVRGRDDAVLAR